MIDISFIMGFFGLAIGTILGVLVYSELEPTVDCPNSTEGNTSCVRAKNTTWTVIGMLPISMFFVLFTVFGGFQKIF